jgi:Flp pilus assembly pilin Flp
MSQFIARLESCCDGEEAASLVEYGLLVGLIAIGCIGAVSVVGQSLSVRFFIDIAGTLIAGRPLR